MSKYASLLFAPEKYYEVGPFRFPVYEDLVPGESRAIERLSKQQARHTYNSIKLAQKIAKDKGISTKEAVELMGSSGENNQDIFYEYASELEELQQLSMGAVEQKITLTTLFMKFRGEVKLPKSKEWQRLEDWQEADTENMPGKLLDQITEFISWERDGWPKPEGNDEVEEEQEFSPPRNNS